MYAGIYGDMPRGHLDSLESKLRDPRMQFLFRPGQWAPDKDGTTGADLDALLEAWIGADKPISVFDLSGIPTAVVDDLVGAVLRILYDAIFGVETSKKAVESGLFLSSLKRHMYTLALNQRIELRLQHGASPKRDGNTALA